MDIVRLRPSVPKADIAGMPKVLFPGRVFVIFTEAEAAKAVDYLRTQAVVGVDTETRPSFKRGQVHKVALLQLSTPDTCFLFRLNRLGIPEPLQAFLADDTLKVGLSLKDDFNALRRRQDMHPERGRWVELQDYVTRFGIRDLSLQKIYANLFGERISKSQRLSNWEAETLTEGQQLYAATDAWACVKIYERLQELERTGAYELELPEEPEVPAGSAAVPVETTAVVGSAADLAVTAEPAAAGETAPKKKASRKKPAKRKTSSKKTVSETNAPEEQSAGKKPAKRKTSTETSTGASTEASAGASTETSTGASTETSTKNSAKKKSASRKAAGKKSAGKSPGKKSAETPSAQNASDGHSPVESRQE